MSLFERFIDTQFKQTLNTRLQIIHDNDDELLLSKIIKYNA